MSNASNEPEFYGTQAVAEMAGVTVRQLNYWVNEKFLSTTPMVGHEESKSGQFWIWHGAQLERALRFSELVNAGFEPAGVAKILDQIDESGSATIGSRFELALVDVANVEEVDASDLTGSSS